MNRSFFNSLSIFILSCTLSLSLSSYSYAKTKVFKHLLGHSDECGSPTSYKTGKKACKSKKFKGQKLYECKEEDATKHGSSGKKWFQFKTFECSRNGSKKGVYVGSCGGKVTSYTNLDKACADPTYFQKTLYQCDLGATKKKRHCEGRRGDRHDKKKKAFFRDSCRGSYVGEKKNLKHWCKKNTYTDKVLVRCKNRCTKSEGFSCKRRVWKSEEAAICGQGEKAHLIIKKCTPNEHELLRKDYVRARQKVGVLVGELHRQLKKNHSKKEKKRFEKALKKLKNVRKRLRGERIEVSCEVEGNMCQATVNAHTFPVIGPGFKTCPAYFDGRTDLERVATFVHEFMHKEWCNDKEYWNANHKPHTRVDWSEIAATYGYWVQHGFCVPGKC